MWKDLSFRERAELINKWHKEHITDYAAKKREYDESVAHRFDDGGVSNPMNYEYRGTIHSDELKNQGITHVAELPETVITGKSPDRPYFSSYDPMALYRYGVEPALEGVGKAVDVALTPVDKAIDIVSSPAWWINKAVTRESDNAVDRARDWAKTAVRDAGMLLSPTRDIGTVASGFKYAPWNPDNPGIAGNDEVGQAVNNTFDLLLSPVTARVANKGLDATVLSRLRDASYNNITPWSYKSKDLGSYSISKGAEFLNTAGDFVLNPGKIGTSYPYWKQRFDNWAIKNPDEAMMLRTVYDEDVINLPAIMEFRDQAWAKAMRQPDSYRWKEKIYKDNGNGTYSYDLDAVDAIRTRYGNLEFSGYESEPPHGGPGYADNITTNGGGVGITKYPDGTIRMQDVWDLQPFLSKVNSWLNPNEYTTPTRTQKAVSVLPDFMKKGLKKAGEFEFVNFVRGNPFELDMSWNPSDPRFGLK